MSRLTWVAALCVTAALSGCSRAAGTSAPPSVTPAFSTSSGNAFTVAGVNPVDPNGSMDTHAQTPNAGCDSATFLRDKAVGDEVAAGFAVANFPVAAYLLRHFLSGDGTRVDYPAGSPISTQALASSAFRAVNNEVQQAILSQLATGAAHVRLSAAQLPTVAFESKTSDLYWGFRGTQGLTVTGGGSRENGRYVGTLSYVISDSYGFPVGDTLDGFGPPMRYLQTACGAPQHTGGAHWFPDTITVIVPFRQSAG
jgi:hypothetical protein